MNNYKTEVFFTAVFSTVFAAIFLLQPAAIIKGLQKGLTICGTSVIPSLFPFMVLSDFLVRSGFSVIIGRKLSFITDKLFRLPGAAGCAVVMGLAGGFPVGAKMTAQLYSDGVISARQGRRMMLFCINAGPAFVIGTVGTAMLSSTRAGVILFVSVTSASLIAGIASRLIDSETGETYIEKNQSFNASVLSDSVAGSVQAMLNVCAWIMLFSGLNEFFVRLTLSEKAAVWFSMVTEVTGGCAKASAEFPTCIIALVLGWSGFAVHCQLMPYLKKVGMKLSYLWASRILVGGMAAIIAMLLFKRFPCDVSVFSNASEIISKPYSVSAPAAAAMLMLSVLMLIDIKPCTKEKDVL